MRYCFISVPSNKLIRKFKPDNKKQDKISYLKHYVAQLRECKTLLDTPDLSPERKKHIEKCIEINKHLISEIQKQICEKRIKAIKLVTPHMQKYKTIQNSFNQSQK
ncbi:MAG: hypothetical protein MJ158_01910 [Alphaproteobacteria bacterium]|nr:hypothetical protein [Alphaproteobacteria bacterium]